MEIIAFREIRDNRLGCFQIHFVLQKPFCSIPSGTEVPDSSSIARFHERDRSDRDSAPSKKLMYPNPGNGNNMLHFESKRTDLERLLVEAQPASTLDPNHAQPLRPCFETSFRILPQSQQWPISLPSHPPGNLPRTGQRCTTPLFLNPPARFSNCFTRARLNRSS